MSGVLATAKREIMRMGRRKMYLFAMVVVPLLIFLFFVSLLSEGLPLRAPVSIVDMDHSTMSRSVIRSLNSSEMIEVTDFSESFADAMTAVRRGDVFGFFVIPANFEQDAVAGLSPTLEFFSNLTYFVPGTLTFKGFKTVAVTTAGGVVRAKLTAMGVPEDMTAGLLQPMAVENHPVGNPWMNYSIYLSPSFCFGALALMIMLTTVFSVTMEIKNGTSPEWLRTAGGHISVAVAGKLLPHFVVWSVIGQFLISLLFGWCGFPCGSIWALVVAMELFVIATMAVAVIFCCIVPNPRLAFSIAALISILAFSFLGFSFPVQNMYGAIAVFSYLIPTRYMFLIYIFSGLDGFPLYYSRLYFAALIVFPLLAVLPLRRLKKFCLNPVYVP